MKIRRFNIKKTNIKYNKGFSKKWLLKDWITYWYKTYKETKHALTTQQVQKTYIRCHIVPGIGNYYIDEIDTATIQQFLNELLIKGNKSKLKNCNKEGYPLASWTVKKIRSLLMTAFEVAVRDDLISYNPVENTEPITVQTLKVAYFTPEQQKLFLDYTQKHRFNTAYQLLFYTGCRRSEILGLTWDNVDLIRSQIYVEKVLVNINGTPIFKNYPKTKASVRTIPLHPDMTKLLKQHKKNQEIEKKNNPLWNNKLNLIFVNKDGSPHSPNYFLHNFKNVVKKLNLPSNLRIHSTRHTFATNLLQLGVPLVDVQHLGGWSDTRVVLEIYSHIVKDSHRSAVEQLFLIDKPEKQKKRKKR